MLGRILVVDDDPDMRLVLREHLEPEGFEVLDAADGADMRAVIAEEEVDLVILDLQLPDEDGLHLAKVLRDKTDAGIVMLTGKGTTVDMVVGREVGAVQIARVAGPNSQRFAPHQAGPGEQTENGGRHCKISGLAL